MATVSPVPTPEELRAAALAAIKRGELHKSEWEVAFHEAGHVVVEVATGSYPIEVYINDGDHAGGDHAGATMTWAGFGVRAVRSSDPDRGLVDARCRRWAAVLAAGDVSGRLACGLELDHYDVVSVIVDHLEGDEVTRDAEELYDLVDDGMTVGQAETWLEEAFAEAERLLRKHWGDVERVAAALVEKRHLTQDDLRDLLPDTDADTVPEDPFGSTATGHDLVARNPQALHFKKIVS